MVLSALCTVHQALVSSQVHYFRYLVSPIAFQALPQRGRYFSGLTSNSPLGEIPVGRGGFIL